MLFLILAAVNLKISGTSLLFSRSRSGADPVQFSRLLQVIHFDFVGGGGGGFTFFLWRRVENSGVKVEGGFDPLSTHVTPPPPPPARKDPLLPNKKNW